MMLGFVVVFTVLDRVDSFKQGEFLCVLTILVSQSLVDYIQL